MLIKKLSRLYQKMIRQAYLDKAEDLKTRFNRSLPFQDALFDRWERAKALNFAKGASIYNSAFVFGEVIVGEQTWIGPYVILDGSAGQLSIGDFCSISAGVHIYTHDTVLWALSKGKAAKKCGDVSIGDGCYIGPQSIIRAGVKIADHVIVGANSYVNSDVPERMIVVGNPAKIIGRVNFDNDQIIFEYDER